MAKCLWNLRKECECPIGKSSILSVSASAFAFYVGQCEALRQELAEYGCQPAKEDGKEAETSAVEQ